MGKTCYIKECRASTKKNPGYSFHSFPQNPLFLSKWINEINRLTDQKIFKEQLTANNFICEQHFKEEDYVLFSTKKILKPEAVPSKCKRRFSCVEMNAGPSGENILPNKILKLSNPDQKNLFSAAVLPPKLIENMECLPCHTKDKTIHRLKDKLQSRTKEIKMQRETIRRLQKKVEKLEASKTKKDVKCSENLNTIIPQTATSFDILHISQVENIKTENEEPDIEIELKTDDLAEDQEINVIPISNLKDGNSDHLIDEENDWTTSDANGNEELNKEENARNEESPGVAPKKRGPRECDVCHRMLKNSFLWQKHQVTHNTSRLICKICNKKYSSIENLSRHVKIKHEHQLNYKCSICSKSFGQSTTLKGHMLVHSNSRISCDQCPRSYKDRVLLEIHKYTHIPVDEQTEEMKQALLKKKVVAENMRKYTASKCICPVCGKHVTRGWLDTHMRGHTGEKPFECAICGKCSGDRCALRTHMYQHTGEKPLKCEFCSAAFRQHAHLRIHMKIHTGEKSHKCTICCKDFRHKSALIEHIRVHTGEKPFHCRICSETFINAKNLRNHYRKVHFTGEDLQTAADIQRKLDEVLKDVPINERVK